MIDVIRTPTVAETIEIEIKFIMEKYEQLSGTDELEMILKEAFKRVQEVVEVNTVNAADAWICEFCEEIFVGRNFEEAEIEECEFCSCIACHPCMEDHFLKIETGFQCRECEIK